MRINSERYVQRENLSERFAPKTDLNDDTVRPPAPLLQPAKWLPVKFELESSKRGKNPFSIAKGKPVALERGNDFGLVPAGIGLLMQAGEFAYTSLDVDWYTEDITTGEPVAAAVTYTAAQIANAILERGFITEDMFSDEGGVLAQLPRQSGTAITSAAADAVIDAFISRPIGFAPQHIHPYLGSAEKGDMKFTNFTPMHKTNFHTEWCLQLPRMVAAAASQAVNGGSASATMAVAGDLPTAGEWIDAAQMASIAYFSAAGVESTDDLAFLKLTDNTLAAETSRTLYSENNGAILVRARSSIATVTKAGDYYVSEQMGGVVVYDGSTGGWAAIAANVTFTFYEYDTAVASGEREAGIYGDVRPGDRLTFDKRSNYVKAVTGTTAEDKIIGRMYHVLPGPVGGLERVRTGHMSANVDKRSRMPGSATDGYSDLIAHADENAADQLAYVIFKISV